MLRRHRGCAYCWRAPVATVFLPYGPLRRALNLPRRERYVCASHLHVGRHR